MAMQRGGRQRNAGAGRYAAGRGVAWRRGCRLATLALCLAAGGCATIAPMLSPLAQNRDITVAVESVDGPPHEISQRLISDLNAEGAPLRIAVVGAEVQAATYRMRGYLATRTAGPMTAVTWAWDVYDGGLNRAFRLTGEEHVAAGTARSWAVADEALLHRIAHAGMDQLAAFMAAPPAPAVPPPPVPAGPPTGTGTVASRAGGSEPPGAAFTGTRLAEATARH
jgi:hypothetical protein